MGGRADAWELAANGFPFALSGCFVPGPFFGENELDQLPGTPNAYDFSSRPCTEQGFLCYSGQSVTFSLEMGRLDNHLYLLTHGFHKISRHISLHKTSRHISL